MRCARSTVPPSIQITRATCVCSRAQFWHHLCSLVKLQLNRRFKLRHVNHVASEMDYLAECIATNANPLTPGEEGLADMRIIEKIDKAAQSGKTVKV